MKFKLTITAIIIVLILAGNLPLIQRFTITDEKSGRIVFQGRVEEYQNFYTSFTHSVNRTPVNEYYRIAGDSLVLEKATFYSFGAGMPEVGEYGSGVPRIKDGMVQIEDINKVFESFTVYAGTYADHSLNTNNAKILFTQFVKPQTPVTFEVKRISVIAVLWSDFIKQ